MNRWWEYAKEEIALNIKSGRRILGLRAVLGCLQSSAEEQQGVKEEQPPDAK